MKKILISLSIILTFSFSCKRNENILSSHNTIKNDTMTTQNNNSIEKVLEKQLLHGYGLKEEGLDIFTNYQYKEDDYNVIKQLSRDILKTSRYKIIDNQMFKIKIKEIFNIDYNNELVNILVENPCKMEKITYQLDENYILSNNNPIFIDDNMILESLLIPELIDYKSKYPVVSEIENSVAKQRQINSDTFSVVRWADKNDLQELQSINNQKLIHRNKYLLNDNKASLTWLKFNDKIFLESLVKTFGYTKDKSLLIHVLRNNYKNISEFQKVLWNEPCNQKIKLNQEVFDIIKESASDEQKQYLNAISDYLVSEVVNKSNSSLNKNFAVKAEIIGKIAYYATKIGEPHKMYYDFFKILSTTDGGNIYDEEFEKKNYYGISDFKAIWDETRYGGISLPEME